MSERDKKFWQAKLALFRGDREAMARWMAYTLKAASIKSCRALIAEAAQ